MKLLIFIKSIFTNNQRNAKRNTPYMSDTIKLQIEKYEETYKLLEEYDKKSIKTTDILAESGRLRDAITKLQRDSRDRRINSAI